MSFFPASGRHCDPTPAPRRGRQPWRSGASSSAPTPLESGLSPIRSPLFVVLLVVLLGVLAREPAARRGAEVAVRAQDRVVARDNVREAANRRDDPAANLHVAAAR